MKRAYWFRIESRDLLAMSRGMKPHDVGIYMILSSLMHDRQEPLAYEPARLAHYCGTSKSAFEKAVNRLICDGLFLLENGKLWSEHIQSELARYDEISEKARSSANARHKKAKENQSPSDADAMRSKRKTSDIDAQTHKGSVHSFNNTDDNAPSVAPDGAEGASRSDRISNDEIRYFLGILKDRDVEEAVRGKIWNIHTTRGLDATMLRTIKQMAREGRLTEAVVDHVAGGKNA